MKRADYPNSTLLIEVFVAKKWMLQLPLLLSGCAYTPEQIAAANDRIRLYMERECATSRLGPGEGYRVPERGMTNTAYHVQCMGRDGYQRSMWFDEMGNLDRASRFKVN